MTSLYILRKTPARSTLATTKSDPKSTDGRVANAPGTGSTARDSSERGQQSTIRELGVMRDKTENWNIMRLEPVYETVVTGRNAAGGEERQRVQRGYRNAGVAYRLTLVNDVVTEVRASAGI